MEHTFNFDLINFKAAGGELITKDGWECFQWNITLTHKGKSLNTQYHMGIGHAIKSKFHVKCKSPSVKDVMYSLLMDASANDESFNNWCDNYGYDNDSLKAINTYQQCCEIANKLSLLFTIGELESMREALQDY